MRRFYLILSLLTISLFSFSQEKNDSSRWSTTFHCGGDLMSRYIWRGINLGGNSPATQPWIRIDIGNSKHTLSIGAWGSYSMAGTSNEECDLIASYTYKSMLTFMVTDYFFPGLYSDQRDKYFYYNQDSTGHVVEACVSFNGTKDIPLTFMACTNVYGNDARRMKSVNDTTFRDNCLMYTTYLELGYKKTIRGIDVNPFIGGTITKPDTKRNEVGYFGNTKAGITNLGIRISKAIPVTEHFAIPLQGVLIADPVMNKIFMVFGISFTTL
ncbi:MAG: TorF family putative porin [Bacteroidota bacterium]|nr:TorF family putative porin [Bacteroidota bacterium]